MRVWLQSVNLAAGEVELEGVVDAGVCSVVEDDREVVRSARGAVAANPPDPATT
jgi:hypothetical protein